MPVLALLADEPDATFEPSDEPFEVVRLDDLALASAPSLLFGYDQQSLSYAMTPYLLSLLLDRGYEQILFIKQESLVAAALDAPFASLDTNAIALTFHLLGPLQGERRGGDSGGRPAGVPRARRAGGPSWRPVRERPRQLPLRGCASPSTAFAHRTPSTGCGMPCIARVRICRRCFPITSASIAMRFHAWTREHGVGHPRIDRAFLDTDVSRRGLRRLRRD